MDGADLYSLPTMRVPGKGTLLAALLAGVGILLAGITLRVHATTHPPRRSDAPPDLETMQLDFEQVEFAAVDGVRLQGWHLPGEPGVSPIVLCHDLGRSRASMFALAFDLSQSGFPLLIFDFRGHGSSGGEQSTLGLEEKRDVLGAVDFLSSHSEYHGLPVGIYGVGMGAHAAALAAADRRSIRVLILDGLYPDASFLLLRRVYGGWGTGMRRLGLLPEAIFTLLTGNRPNETRAADVVPELRDRDVLLLAAAGDTALVEEIERIYESIPEQRYVDGNMELHPASQSRSLFGEERNRHHGRVREFFVTRLQQNAQTRRASGGETSPKNRNNPTTAGQGTEGI
jgi:pimeloyl-ACP methyl ester carboxylesterase